MGEFSRREFLKGAGGLAAAVLAGCSPRRRAAPGSAGTAAVTPSRAAQTPSPVGSGGPPPNWAALRARLGGSLVLPGDRGYTAAAQSFNSLFDGRRPAAVAACATPADVQACVALAASSRIPLAARSGGHSYAGYSVPDGGLVVDISAMTGVRLQFDNTAVVGAGTRQVDVYDGLAASGRCVPGGICPTVGIAGLTLGGGVGVLARQFGLTCDHLVAATLVTADATLHTNVSAVVEPDLFWALRGGGGGNLGIVTSFTLKSVPAPDVVVMAVSFPGVPAAPVFGAWQSWMQAAPMALWSNCTMSAGSPPSALVNATFLGSLRDAAGLLDDLARRAGTPAAPRSVTSKNFLDAMLYFAGCARGVAACRLAGSGGRLGRDSFAAASRVMSTLAGDPGKVAELVTGRSGMDVTFEALGGAVAALAPDATAFPHRAALATVRISMGTTSAGRPAATQAVADVRDGLGPLIGSGAYVNYIDPGLADWGQAYYGVNLTRLRRVAHTYDPDRVFSFAQGLGRA